MALFLPRKLALESREETEFVRHLGGHRRLYEATWNTKRKGEVVALSIEKGRSLVLASSFFDCGSEPGKETERAKVEEDSSEKGKERVSRT